MIRQARATDHPAIAAVVTAAFGRADEADLVTRLRADLDSGAWDRRYGTLRTQPEFTGSLRLITAQSG